MKGLNMFKPLILMLSIVTITYSQTDDLKPDSAGIQDFSWLSGSWISEREGSVTEEMWMAPKGNIMTGTGRTVFTNNKAFFEFMRIAQSDSGIYFFGSPKGENTTPFKLTKTGRNYIEFENLSHDFPQRIIYKLIEPGTLYARVEGILNNKLEFEEWNYSRNIDGVK